MAERSGIAYIFGTESGIAACKDKGIEGKESLRYSVSFDENVSVSPEPFGAPVVNCPDNMGES